MQKLIPQIIFVLFVLFALSSQSQGGLDDAVKTVEEANKNTDPALSPNSCAPEATAPKPDFQALLLSCAFDLCGPAKDIKNIADHYKIDEKDPEIKKYLKLFESEIEPTLSRHMDAVFDEKRLEVGLIKKFFNDQKSYEPKFENYYFFNLRLVRSMTNQIKFKQINKLIVFDPDETKKAIRKTHKISGPILEKVMLFLDKLYQSESGARFLRATTQTSREYFQYSFPHLNLGDALERDAHAFQISFEKLQGSEFFRRMMRLDSPEIERLIAFQTDIKQIARGKELTSSDVDAYLDMRFLLLKMMAFSEIESTKEFSNELFEDLSLHFQSQISENIEPFLNLLNDRSYLEKQKALAITRIKSRYVLNIVLSPPEAKLTEGEAMANLEKRTLLQRLLWALPKNTIERMGTKLDKISFQFPESREQYHSKFQAYVQRDFSNFQNEASQRILSLSSPDALISRIYGILDLDKDLNKVSSNQMRTLFKPFIDNFHFFLNRIEIGSAGILDPKSGRMVINHELGHGIYSIASQEAYSGQHHSERLLAVMDCLDSMHSSEPGYAPNKYIEEDWADLIAARVSHTNDTNFACKYLKKDLSGESYIDLSLINPDSNDVHSSFLFRALHIHQIYHGSLPLSCTDALKNAKNPPKISSCL